MLVILLFGVCALLAARLERLGMVQLAGTAIVHDGDTVTLARERIRLSGIDAFEKDQICERGGQRYACGREAEAHLLRLAAGSNLVCEGTRRDRYGRLLAACRAGGIDLNREMVAAGWALAYGDYGAEELAAQLNHRGAWQGEFAKPQEWRATNGRPTENQHNLIGWLLEKVSGFLL